MRKKNGPSEGAALKYVLRKSVSQNQQTPEDAC